MGSSKPKHCMLGVRPSSETQGQLVGATGFSRAKVYNKSGRAPGHLLLPNEFQKRLKSRLLIGQQIFLANQRAGFLDASGTRSARVNAQGLSRSCCKLSPVKILSPQLAAPGSPRMVSVSQLGKSLKKQEVMYNFLWISGFKKVILVIHWQQNIN